MNILIIEDDLRIHEFLARGLRAEGHIITVVDDGAEGLQKAQELQWDVIILDLMLPSMDGREICRTLRADNNKVPILMLTALDATMDVVRGLKMGANDYLTKPFAFDELLARLETIGNRSDNENQNGQLNNSVLKIHDLEFNLDALTIRRGKQDIELTSLEMSLLEFLMVENGKVISRARILQNVWGASKDPLTNIVDVYVRKLRSKIDDPFDVKLISTIRGRGYRLGV